MIGDNIILSRVWQYKHRRSDAVTAEYSLKFNQWTAWLGILWATGVDMPEI